MLSLVSSTKNAKLRFLMVAFSAERVDVHIPLCDVLTRLVTVASLKFYPRVF